MELNNKLIHPDTAVLITSYTGFKNPEIKRMMLNSLVNHLDDGVTFICVASHSPVDVETQNHCNLVIYDPNNSWQICGIPYRPNHGVAELTSIHNGINALKRFGFKYILKQCFDVCPVVNYNTMINKCKAMNKKLVTYENATDLGTLMFFSEIEFFEKTLSLDEIWRFEGAIERGWKDSIREKGLLNEVMGFDYDNFNNLIGLKEGQQLHYSHFREDGNLLHDYPYGTVGILAPYGRVGILA